MPALPAFERCGSCGAETSAEGFCPACMLECGLTEGEDSDSSFFGVTPLGDYELLGEIARGGMGVVYKAWQKSLNRTVAIKMVLAGRLAGESELRRFQAEAETAARLQHPNIVAVHEVGEYEGQPFFSMDYVEGQSLADLVRNEPLPAKRAATYLKTIAEAVEYAHSKGVLHRDLKPSNILIDQNDQARITDFGLAKRLNDHQLSTINHQLTVTGQVLGSPNFMAPEQATGDREAVGAPSDVYSLGAVLYQLLTGRPPFLAETLTQTLWLVAEAEPTSLRILNPSVPRDLETICLKCLAKDGAKRYPTAKKLDEDLTRFLGDEPILARPVSHIEKFHRWCRRHPAVAALAAVVLGLLLTVAIGSTIYATRLKAANVRATEKLREAYLGQAQAERWSGRAGRRSRGLGLLGKAAEIRPSVELRSAAIACLALEDLKPLKEFSFSVDNNPYFDRSCQRYATVDENGIVIVRNLANGYEEARLPQLGKPNWGALSPDGRYVLANLNTDATNFIQIYDLESKHLILSVSNHLLRSFDYSADASQLILALDNPSRLVKISLPSGQEQELCALSVLAGDLRLSPSGAKVAIACEQNQELQVRNTIRGDLLSSLTLPGYARGLNWYPDGELLATGCSDNNIYICNTTTGERDAVLKGHTSLVTAAWLSHDGNRLISGSWDRYCRLWNPWTGRQILSLPAADVSYLAPDDSLVVLKTKADMLQLCKYEGRREWRELSPRTDFSSAWHCAWSPDGRVLVSGDRGGLRLWVISSGQQARIPFDDNAECWSVTFDRAGKFIVAGTALGLRCWPITWNQTPEGNSLTIGTSESFGPRCSVGMFCLNNDGNLLATSCNANAQLYEWPSRRAFRELVVPPGAAGLWGGVMSGSGHLCLGWPFKPYEPRWVWNSENGAIMKTLPAESIYGAAFTSDDRCLITGSDDRYVAWDTQSWVPIWEKIRQSAGSFHAQVALTRDGTLGALTLSADTIQLFAPMSGEEYATLQAPEPQAINSLAFSPDETLLAATTRAGSVHIWDLRLIRQELAAMHLDWDGPPLLGSKTSNSPTAPLRVMSVGLTNQEVHVRLTIPNRRKDCGSKLIDLTKYYNASLNDSWFNPIWVDNNLASLPPAPQLFNGIQFDARGIIQLGGTHPNMSRHYPFEISGIDIKQSVRALHFLHSSGWVVPDGTQIAFYVIHYADGHEMTVPLVSAESIRSWARKPDDSVQMGAQTQVAWRGTNPSMKSENFDAVLYHFRFVNPRPDVEISTIDFRSARTVAAPYLLAISVE